MLSDVVLAFALLIVLVGVVLFAGKLMLTRGFQWIERSFNADIAEATRLANDLTPPAAWLVKAAAQTDPARGKQVLMGNLERVIRRVTGGKAFEADAREYALKRLHAVRELWQQQTFDEIGGNE